MKTASIHLPQFQLTRVVSLFIAAMLLGLTALPLRADPVAKVVPPSSMKFGNDYAGWSASWWKWFMELPVISPSGVTHPSIDSPTFDVTEGQTGNVWFLASPFGASIRNCTIPANTALFIGLLNVEASDLEGLGATAAEQRANAKFQADHIINLSAQVDGQDVKKIDSYRVTSPQFSFSAPTPWIFGDTGGTGTSVADGYFLLIDRMTSGLHTIHIKGAFHFAIAEGDPFDFDASLDSTYNITVP